MGPMKSHSQESEIIQEEWGSLEFLTHCTAEGDDFLQRIVTDDKSWVYHWTPSMKKASRMWKTAREQHCWSSKNIHLPKRSQPLFFGTGTVSCYSNFIHKTWLSLQVHISIPLSSCKWLSRRNVADFWVKDHQFDPKSGKKKYDAGNFEAFTAFTWSRSIRFSHISFAERRFGRKAF